MWPFKRKTPITKPAVNPEIDQAYQQLVDAMRPWRDLHARQAWIPITIDGDGSEVTSYFGGAPMVTKEADWPICGACGKPMPFCMQLDSRTLPDGAPRFGVGLLQFFYCGSCEEGCGDGTWEPFDRTQKLRVISPGDLKRCVTPEGVQKFPKRVIQNWQRVEDHPDLDDAELLGLSVEYLDKGLISEVHCPALGIELNEIHKRLDDDAARRFQDSALSARGGDKLGGWPVWIQRAASIACPQCKLPMCMLFQIDSGDHLAINLGDTGCSHIWQCPTHAYVLAFEWQCF
ncbi:MAG: DUF1963 domain-containing protein [Phycisphaerales bacterium]|nr:DUF1963 domain-containing protein [Phycisphaerales bacterium]MCB9862683.1 DUF1963 domain-containing protein [Phycisphaerales bacterium]